MSEIITPFLKKTVISIFIGCFLWVTIGPNLNLIFRTQIAAPPLKADPSFVSFLNVSWYEFNDKLGTLGSLLAVRNTWNMFGVVDRSAWSTTISSIDSTDGAVVKLPYAANSNNWQDSLLNFRESKLFQNLNSNNYLQNLYTQYLCKKDSSLRALKFSRSYQTITPPEGLSDDNFFSQSINNGANYYSCQR